MGLRFDTYEVERMPDILLPSVGIVPEFAASNADVTR